LSAKTGKRGTIRILDAREDLSKLFDGRGDGDIAPGPSCEEEESFSRMLEDTLSGVDQAAIIRQKHPEPDLSGSKKHKVGAPAKPRAELDLHGCHVHEALVRVEAFIETSALQGIDAVRIIVGKGLHSQGNAVLPDAVAEKIVELKRRGRVATFAWEKKRKRASGALLVYLK
jgi:DNA-nicking Smr family endonuclease